MFVPSCILYETNMFCMNGNAFSIKTGFLIASLRDMEQKQWAWLVARDLRKIHHTIEAAIWVTLLCRGQTIMLLVTQ